MKLRSLVLGAGLLSAASGLHADSFVAGTAWSGIRQIGYPALAGQTASASGRWEAWYGWSALSGAAHAGRHRVVGRWVFYDRSAWDVTDDLHAIATDKVALLSGQRASFANYTSYSRGLNGIMIDVEGLLGTPGAADFEFRVGNTDSTSAWTPGPAPAEIRLLPGAGTDGSDRVVLTWGDQAVRRAWLEVRVRATLVTGLPSDDVFYFGNAVGETGNQPGVDAFVNASDEAVIRANTRGAFAPAARDNPYDINRDRRVNAADQLLARGNATDASTALALIRPGSAPGGGGAAPVLAFTAKRIDPDVPQASSSGGPRLALGPDAVRPRVTDEAADAPILTVVTLPGGRVRLSYPGSLGSQARLESSVDGVRWGPIGVESSPAPDGGTVWDLDTEGWGRHRWFRLRTVEELR